MQPHILTLTPSLAGVSHEVLQKWESYATLLLQWQKRINLIGNGTANELFSRHIIDSAQLFDYIPKDRPLYDLGSGAGLPGFVLAMMGVKNVTLIESDHRKIAFLREASRVTNTPVILTPDRIEHCALTPDAIITCRALASLANLFSLLQHTLTPHHILLLLKGKTWENEVESALIDWDFTYESYSSSTQEGSVILILHSVRKRGGTHD